MAETLTAAGARRLVLAPPLALKVALFALVWSSAFSAAKLALAECPPLLMLTMRFALAGGAMLAAAAAFRRPLRLARRDLLVFALLGLFNNALYLGLSFVGLKTVSAGLATIIVSANPVVTAAAAMPLLGERLTVRKLIGLGLGVGGVAIIAEDRIGGGIDDPFGIALIVLALLSLVAGTLVYKRLAPAGSLWIGTAVQNIAAGLALAPVALSLESVAEIHVTARLALAILYLALIVSTAGFILWFHLIETSGATTASAFHFLMPPLGLFFGWSVLGETAPPLDLAGVLPVALGIYLVTHRRR